MENVTLSSLRQQNTEKNRNNMSAADLAALTYMQGVESTVDFVFGTSEQDEQMSFTNVVEDRRKKGISGFFSSKAKWIKNQFSKIGSEPVEFDVNGTQFKGRTKHAVEGGPVPIGKGLVINMEGTSLVGADNNNDGAFMRADSKEPQLVYYNDKTKVMSELPLMVNKPEFNIRQNEIKLESIRNVFIPLRRDNKERIKADGMTVTQKGAELINAKKEKFDESNQLNTVDLTNAKIGENGLETQVAESTGNTTEEQTNSEQTSSEQTTIDTTIAQADGKDKNTSIKLLSLKKASDGEKKLLSKSNVKKKKEEKEEKKEVNKDWKTELLEDLLAPGDFLEKVTGLEKNISEKAKIVLKIARGIRPLNQHIDKIISNNTKESTGILDKADVITEEINIAINQYKEIVDYIDNVISFGIHFNAIIKGDTSDEYVQKAKLTKAIVYQLFTGGNFNDKKGIYELAGVTQPKVKNEKEDKIWNPVGAKIIILPGLVAFISLKPDFDFSMSNDYSFDVNLAKSPEDLLGEAIQAWDNVGGTPSKIYDVLKIAMSGFTISAKDTVTGKGSLTADLAAGIKLGIGMLFEGEAAIHALMSLSGALDDGAFLKIEGSHEIDLSQFPNPAKMMSKGATSLAISAGLGITAGIKTTGTVKSELFDWEKNLWDYTAFSWDLAKLNFGFNLTKNAGDSIMDTKVVKRAFSAKVLQKQIAESTTEDNKYGFRISTANADIQNAIKESEEVQEKAESEDVKNMLSKAMGENASEEDIQKAYEDYNKLILRQKDSLLLLDRLKEYATKDPTYVDNVLDANIGISRHEDIIRQMEEVKGRMSKQELDSMGETEYYKIRKKDNYIRNKAATKGYIKKRNNEIDQEAKQRVISREELIKFEKEKMGKASEDYKTIVDSLEAYITEHKITDRDKEDKGFIEYYQKIRKKEMSFLSNSIDFIRGKSKSEMFGLKHNISDYVSLDELKEYEGLRKQEATEKHNKDVEVYEKRILDLQNKLTELGITEESDQPNAKFKQYYSLKYAKDLSSSAERLKESDYSLENLIEYQKETFKNDRYSGKNYRIMEQLKKYKSQIDAEQDEQKKKQILAKARSVFAGPEGYSTREINNQAFRMASLDDIINFETQRINNAQNMNLKNMTDFGKSGKNIIDDVVYNIRGVKTGAKNLFSNIKESWTLKHLNPMRLKLYELSGLNVEVIKKGGEAAEKEKAKFDPSKVYPLLQKEIENGTINPEEIAKRLDLKGGFLDFGITNTQRIKDIKASVSIEYLIEYERSSVKKYDKGQETPQHYKHKNRLDYLLEQQKAIDAVSSVKEKQEIAKKVREAYFNGKLDYILDKKRYLTDDEKAMKDQLKDKSGFLKSAKKGYILDQSGKKIYDPAILMAMLEDISEGKSSEYEERVDRLNELKKNKVSDTHAYDAYLKMGGGRAFREQYNSDFAKKGVYGLKIEQMIRFAEEQLRISSRNQTMQTENRGVMTKTQVLKDKVKTVFGSIKSTASRFGSRIANYFKRKFNPSDDKVLSEQQAYEQFRGGDYEQFRALLDLKELVDSGKIESASPEKVKEILEKYKSSMMKGDGFKDFIRKKVSATLLTPKAIMEYEKSKKPVIADAIKESDERLQLLNGGADENNPLSEAEIRKKYRNLQLKDEEKKHKGIVNLYKKARATQTTDADRHFRNSEKKGYTPNIIINYQKSLLEQAKKKYQDRINELNGAEDEKEAVDTYIKKYGDKNILKKMKDTYTATKLQLQSSSYTGGFKSGFDSAMEFEKGRLEFYQNKKALALLPQKKIKEQSSVLTISIAKNEEKKKKLKEMLERMKAARASTSTQATA